MLSLLVTFIIICVHDKLTFLRERDVRDSNLVKYNYLHELNTFNKLSEKKNFKSIIIKDFSLRKKIISILRRKRKSLNLNQNFNADMKEGFIRTVLT